MRKIAICAVLIVVIGSLLSFAYRNYQAKVERRLSADRLVAERAKLAGHLVEFKQFAAAETEARRMTEDALMKERTAVEHALAQVRSEMASVEMAQEFADNQKAQMAAGLAKLMVDSDSQKIESDRLAEQFERTAAPAGQTRLEALELFQRLEAEKREASAREAARLIAIQRQAEKEAEQQAAEIRAP